jgi:hypothetical protein
MIFTGSSRSKKTCLTNSISGLLPLLIASLDFGLWTLDVGLVLRLRILEIFMPHETLTEIRRNVEKRIKNSYLRRIQAPQGVKPALKAWMEIS